MFEKRVRATSRTAAAPSRQPLWLLVLEWVVAGAAAAVGLTALLSRLVLQTAPEPPAAGPPAEVSELDVIKVALSVIVGGAVALVVAYRRQPTNSRFGSAPPMSLLAGQGGLA